jgi:hypothetical protein
MFYLRQFLCLSVLLLLTGSAFGESPAAFPLKVSDSGRYLVDQQGKPFLLVGDTAWSIIVEASDADMRDYLADRQKKGFNATVVNLLEHKFTSNPPKTKAGLAPFNTPGDFSTPNDRYFDFAHKFVKEAGDKGIVVWLAPAYLGYEGNDEGWFKEMKASGKETLRKYGRYIGERFKDLPNIVWVNGGDYAPAGADRWTVNEVAEGIREGGATQLQTAHAARKQSGAPAFGDPSWLAINTTYVDKDEIFHLLAEDYKRSPVHPFVLFEGYYENENNMTPELIRCQAYASMLSGACGQFFGNSPIWHFDGPGVFKQKIGWRKALSQRGSMDMCRVRELFAPRPWHLLVPDLEHKVVTKSTGQELGTAVTARTPDGKLAITYVSSAAAKSRSLTVDMAQFAGPVTARWYNPTSGHFTPASDKPLGNSGSHVFAIPGDNGTKTNDSLLVIEAE